MNRKNESKRKFDEDYEHISVCSESEVSESNTQVKKKKLNEREQVQLSNKNILRLTEYDAVSHCFSDQVFLYMNPGFIVEGTNDNNHKDVSEHTVVNDQEDERKIILSSGEKLYLETLEKNVSQNLRSQSCAAAQNHFIDQWMHKSNLEYHSQADRFLISTLRLKTIREKEYEEVETDIQKTKEFASQKRNANKFLKSLEEIIKSVI